MIVGWINACINNRIWSLPKLSFGTFLFRKKINTSLISQPLTCDFIFSSDRNWHIFCPIKTLSTWKLNGSFETQTEYFCPTTWKQMFSSIHVMEGLGSWIILNIRDLATGPLLTQLTHLSLLPVFIKCNFFTYSCEKMFKDVCQFCVSL